MTDTTHRPCPPCGSLGERALIHIKFVWSENRMLVPAKPVMATLVAGVAAEHRFAGAQHRTTAHSVRRKNKNHMVWDVAYCA